MNKKITRTITASVLTFSLAASLSQTEVTSAAAKKINRKRAVIYVGKTCRLKISGRPGTITWKSSNKKVAAVNKKGLVRAKKAGTAKITGKSAKKKWTCRITVKKYRKKPSYPTPTENPGSANKPATSVKPAVTPAPVPTKNRDP